MNWYYHDGEKAIGPLSIEAIRHLRDCGMLAADTPAALEGAFEWDACDGVLSTVPIASTVGLPEPPPPSAASVMTRLIWGLGTALGLDVTLDAGGFRTLFKDTFKKRDIGEIDYQFAISVLATTPRPEEVDYRMPAPWVFFRLILASMAGTIGFYWALMRFANVKLIPGWIFMGHSESLSRCWSSSWRSTCRETFPFTGY